MAHSLGYDDNGRGHLGRRILHPRNIPRIQALKSWLKGEALSGPNYLQFRQYEAMAVMQPTKSTVQTQQRYLPVKLKLMTCLSCNCYCLSLPFDIKGKWGGWVDQAIENPISYSRFSSFASYFPSQI
jgi:hypothetical protein